MSGCSCPEPRKLRVSGEVWPNGPDIDSIGGGEKAVRVRCSTCGGKVGHVGSDLLIELFGIPGDEIVNGRCLSRDERCYLEVDLV